MDKVNYNKAKINIIRFLKARSWDLQSSEKMIRKDIQWRQEFRPDLTDCKNCHNQPGTHSLRQIGFDEAGRPIIYASFSQAISNRNMSNDAITHLIYTIENAIKSMKSGVTQWVFVIDCTGVNKDIELNENKYCLFELDCSNKFLSKRILENITNHLPTSEYLERFFLCSIDDRIK
ncbi:unnamed protein product [Schistosoma rodhaini]|uniref:CRAL-TRIO domain-containing protein n=1 Tax=Schistosoma rodhaini TaxID=6188 RepID=A0AA85GH68_9TREM|nr:unnamed protein product [Schistosoma rodhaini]